MSWKERVPLKSPPWAERGLGWVCVVQWHLVSVRTFGVMYDHALSKLVSHQIRHEAIQSEPSAWWLHMVKLFFLRGLCGYVWANILTLSPLREVQKTKGNYQLHTNLPVAKFDKMLESRHWDMFQQNGVNDFPKANHTQCMIPWTSPRISNQQITLKSQITHWYTENYIVKCYQRMKHASLGRM